MKKTIKILLEHLGLLSFAKKIANKIGVTTIESSLDRYKNINYWYLKYRGLNLVYDTSEWYSKKWFFPRYDEGRIHEPTTTDIFIDKISSNSIVLDIGGHLGYFSCIAGKLAKNGFVHVFEVDPKCLNLITNNLLANKLSNVQVHNYAVSDSKETIKIPKFEIPNAGLKINSTSSNDYIEIKSLVIDDFLSQNNIDPDFIKIDIEGAEWKALNGMKKTLEHKNVTILVEIHVDDLCNYFDTNYKEIIKLLLNYGYTLKEIEHREADGNFKIIDKNTKLKGNTMILCSKSN